MVQVIYCYGKNLNMDQTIINPAVTKSCSINLKQIKHIWSKILSKPVPGWLVPYHIQAIVSCVNKLERDSKIGSTI